MKDYQIFMVAMAVLAGTIGSPLWLNWPFLLGFLLGLFVSVIGQEIELRGREKR